MAKYCTSQFLTLNIDVHENDTISTHRKSRIHACTTKGKVYP